MAERDESLDCLGLAFEDRLDGAVGAIAHRARDCVAFGEASRRVAEEDALDMAVDDDAFPYDAHRQSNENAGYRERTPSM